MRGAIITAHLLLLTPLACRGSHERAASGVAKREEVSDAIRIETPPTRLILPGRGVVVGRTWPEWARIYGITWEPNLKQIEEFEAVLERDPAGKLPAKSADLARRMRDYKRQYVGVSEGGRHVMRVYMFCKVPSDWPDKLYAFPADGGPCFVVVGYDPAAKTLSFVSVGQTE